MLYWKERKCLTGGLNFQGAYHVIYRGSDERERSACQYYVSNRSLICSLAEIQGDTFKVMWNLSAPGGEAEGCFRRLKTMEYYYDKLEVNADEMPDVRPCGSCEVYRLISRLFSFKKFQNVHLHQAPSAATPSTPTLLILRYTSTTSCLASSHMEAPLSAGQSSMSTRLLKGEHLFILVGVLRRRPLMPL